MDTQRDRYAYLLHTLLYLDMWAMVMLAPCRQLQHIFPCLHPHSSVYNIYRSARSARPDQLAQAPLAVALALAQILPTQLHNLDVSVCVLCQ